MGVLHPPLHKITAFDSCGRVALIAALCANSSKYADAAVGPPAANAEKRIRARICVRFSCQIYRKYLGFSKAHAYFRR